MKAVNILLILLAAAFWYGCNPTDMTTIIHDDGSCTRFFSQTVSPEFMQGDTSKNPFPVDLDANWKVKWSYRTPDYHSHWPVKEWKWEKNDTDKIITAIAIREFKSVKEMSDSFRFKSDYGWHDLRVNAQLEKKFRWFYTFYTYKETFPQLPIKYKIPIDKYLTKDEASFWLTGRPNLLQGMNGIEIKDFTADLENKFGRWMLENIWEMQYEALLTHLNLFPNAPDKEKVKNAKDNLFKIVQKLDLDKALNFNIGRLLNNYFKTSAFDSLADEENAAMKPITEPEDIRTFSNFNSQSINYKLMMPGKLMETNGAVSNDTISWKVDSYRMMNSAFQLQATSKKFNIWPSFVSAIIVIAGLFFLFYKKK
ncbi:MAG TPA: hypothetical protein PK110_13070 [Niabella sp.]|jgi:hypothetical protein|nr:hypothetical protein [Chitinophagaceae bacterium]HRO85750.1 hypothetical protein [Niabella sp.]HUN01638.1 hypothetical protein [Niabella sp.]